MQKSDMRYLCYLAKIAFNRSHLACVLITTLDHLSTIKIFPGGGGSQGGGQEQGNGSPPSGAAHGGWLLTGR